MKPRCSVTTKVHLESTDVLNDSSAGRPRIAPATILVACIFGFLIGSPAYGQAHGTAAIAIWQPDRIVIATDSKVIHLNGEPPDTICKVRRSGRFFFPISGFYGRTGSDFDVWDIATRSVKTAHTVPDAAAILEHRIAAGLPKALESARLSNPDELKKKLSESYLAFFVAGIDAGKPVMAGRNFGSRGVLKREYPGTNPVVAGATGLAVFGDRNVIDRMYTPQRQVTLAAGDPIGTARSFVQLEIDGESAAVGGPRSILVIAKNGHRWEEHGLCK